MRRPRFVLAASCAAACLVPVSAGATAGPPAFLPAVTSLSSSDATLVGIRPARSAEAIVRAAGAEPIARKLGIWRLSTSRARAILPALRGAGLLRYAEPDQPQQKDAYTTGDPLAVPEIGWHLSKIGADQVAPPGPGVPVTVVDSGLDMNHMEFKTRPDTVLLNAQPTRTWDMATLYHGTTVSSVAAAPADGVGTIGVYPTAVLREFAVGAVFDAPLTSDIVLGIVRAGDGRNVINLSLSGPSFSRSEYEAIISATRHGALVVAAAGNEFRQGSPMEYPASLPHVLTIASTGPTDAPSVFSNRSDAMDLAAPGESIPVQHPSDPTMWRAVSGTSFSSPMVAAAAAWVWTVHPELDATQIADILRASAHDIWETGFDDRTGYGLLNIPAALAQTGGPADVQEPNDDIDQIAPGRLFATGRAPLTTLTKRSAHFDATLDGMEDPNDVYRVVVPARRTVTVTVGGSTNIGAILWSSQARTVFAQGKAAQRTQLAGSNRPGRSTERLTYRNTARSAVTVYLDVWLAKNAARRATYTATVTTH
jgi:subtilase family protein